MIDEAAVSIGDNCVDGAQLCNVISLANGMYTAKDLRKIFADQNFSKEALS